MTSSTPENFKFGHFKSVFHRGQQRNAWKGKKNSREGRARHVECANNNVYTINKYADQFVAFKLLTSLAPSSLRLYVLLTKYNSRGLVGAALSKQIQREIKDLLLYSRVVKIINVVISRCYFVEVSTDLNQVRVARAACLFFLVRPIKSLLCDFLLLKLPLAFPYIPLRLANYLQS